MLRFTRLNSKNNCQKLKRIWHRFYHLFLNPNHLVLIPSLPIFKKIIQKRLLIMPPKMMKMIKSSSQLYKKKKKKSIKKDKNVLNGNNKNVSNGKMLKKIRNVGLDFVDTNTD